MILRSDHKQERFLERYEVQTYLIIYRKEKGTRGYFTSKNIVFFFKVKKKWKKENFRKEEECQVSLDCIKVSKLFQNVLWVPISLPPPHIWTALRKMLHKLDYFMIKMGHK